MKSIVRCVCLAAVFASEHSAHADLVWEYNSNDGTVNNVATGRLTTTGNPGDELLVGSVFSLVSIDTAFYNGVDITASTNWFSGNGPPFSSFPDGTIETTGPGVAEITFADAVLVASSTPGSNVIQLGLPGTTFGTLAQDVSTIGQHYSFLPAATTFTIVPEPSAFLCIGLVGLGIVGWKKLEPSRISK